MARVKAAIIGSGNIGTDLMMKMIKYPQNMELAAVVGIDPASEGLAMARSHGIATTHEGIEGLKALPCYPEIGIAFDATSAYAHKLHDEALRADGIQVVDLTPAAIGPFAAPPTTSTARAIEVVGGAAKGKAIIILNPAEPPMIMRDTVFTLSEGADEDAIRASVEAMVAEVQKYVPGYRLKQQVQFERYGDNNRLHIPGLGDFTGIRSMIMLEVEGAGDYLPPYSGNLDIMTAAAKATGELLAARRMAQ